MGRLPAQFTIPRLPSAIRLKRGASQRLERKIVVGVALRYHSLTIEAGFERYGLISTSIIVRLADL